MTDGRHRALLDQLQASHVRGPYWAADIPGSPAPDQPMVRLIAYYLPQFHRIVENDAWWGEGFTEWTNVTKALPRFVGHVQPRLPADLGFYDLTDAKMLRWQAHLARRYGIGGFCFHHYWFNGRRILERPLELFIADPAIDMPFCINWANENWTRRWDGQEDDVLLEQHYSPEDDVAFARHLIPIVSDKRYIHVDGRPLVMIYRPALLPDPMATMRRWRTEFARAGLPNPLLVMAQAFDDRDPRFYGIDAAAEFPPHKSAHHPPINAELTILDPEFSGHVLDYFDFSSGFVAEPRPPYPLFRAVSPSWDNEARKPGRGFTVAHSTPALYGRWLDAACRRAIAEAGSADERIVFVNAWNEWAEGAYLEPDRHFGHAYLSETARVLDGLTRVAGSVNPVAPTSAADGRLRLAIVSHDAHFHGAQTVALALARSLVTDHNVELSILLGGVGQMTPQFEAVAWTHTVPGDFNDSSAWDAAAARLVSRRVTAVLCNTTVSARAIRQLHAAGLRVVQLVHELPSLIKSYQLEDASRDAATYAAAVVFPSRWVRDRFVEIAGPIRGLTVIRHQGLNLRRMTVDERLAKRAETRKRHGIDASRGIVLGIGYGDVRKGLDLWPSLIRQVHATLPDTLFVWIGRTDPTLRHWADHDLKTAGLQDRMLFLDEMPDLSPWYAAADLFLLTSREDPFPSVVVEAMACGLPTVVFEESGGIVELVQDAGGVVVPYLDCTAMSDAIMRLLSDTATAGAIGSALAARITANFDYAGYAAALIALAAPSQRSISVVVPNYNYARHLRQRLESIWNQSVRPLEIIILDDRSTDDSADVIAKLARESPIPIVTLFNDQNSGSVSRQWARGVAQARGDAVWIAEADDVAAPGFLARVLPALDDETVVMSYCESRMIDEAGQVLAPDYRQWVCDVDPTRWLSDFKSTGLDAVADLLSIKNTVPNVSAAVFRRTALRTVLDEHLEELIAYRNAADWLCYIRLLSSGGCLAFTSQSLNSHRRHTASVTIAAADRRHLSEVETMQDLAAELAPVSPSKRKGALHYRGQVAVQFGISRGQFSEHA